VQALLAQGLSRSAISRALGLDLHTVRRFVNANSIDDLLVKTTKASKLDPFKAPTCTPAGTLAAPTLPA
jgi:DNA invertase Pin-like site-specific DNA recombinase